MVPRIRSPARRGAVGHAVRSHEVEPLLFIRILVERLRSRLWFVPALFGLAAAGLAIALVALDRSLGVDELGPFAFGGGYESARLILATIATAMLSFTGLVFTVTMLVLQLASSQLSPRVTRTFLRDRGNQAVLGIFVATFIFALLVLREVRSEAGEVFVPSIAVWWAFVLLLASVVAFIYYIDHMAHAIRASTVIALVSDETRRAIERCFPEPYENDPEGAVPLPQTTAIVLGADTPGTVQAIDLARLVRLAAEADAVLEIVVAVGEAIPGGATIARVRGASRVDEAAIRSAISIGRERTMEQDPGFGFRQLVDIAVRALSVGINDPTTAHLVIDRIHDLLRRLAVRDIPSGQIADDRGDVRVVAANPGWDDFVTLACEEIRDGGASATQVARALERMLADLEAVAPEARRPPIRHERTLLAKVRRRG